MPSIIRILDIARRALQAHQGAMNTASNNIANSQTEGYSRQRVTLAESRPISTAVARFGTGVNLTRVERIRSSFIDLQLIGERASFNQFEFRSGSLQFIEQTFNEPSDFGLNRMLQDFFGGFHDLANDPESTAARSILRQRAGTLTQGFNRLHRQLSDYSQQLNADLQSKVDEVNRYAGEIAHLNKQIVQHELNGQEASTLRDQRDLAIEKLSKLVNIRTHENQFGSVNVALDGKALVMETQSQSLSLAARSGGDNRPNVVFASDGEIARIDNGSIKGLLDVRDVNVVAYIDKLDQLAVNLAAHVNALHQTGFNLDGITGINFFKETVTGADDFGLSPDILNDASLIATADIANEPGNNSIALSLAALQDSLIMDDGQATIGDFYNSFLAQLGSQTQEATFLTESFGITLEKLEFTRDSISGVSLDEEMTHLIQSQQAFTAATRVIATVDEMAQTVLNMV